MVGWIVGVVGEGVNVVEWSEGRCGGLDSECGGRSSECG